MNRKISNKNKLRKSILAIAVITALFTTGNYATTIHANSSVPMTPASPAVTRTVSNVANKTQNKMASQNKNNQNNKNNSVNFSNLTSLASAKGMMMSGNTAMQTVFSNVKNFANNPSKQGAENTKNSIINEFKSNPSLREMIYLTLAGIIAMYIYVKYRVKSYLYA